MKKFYFLVLLTFLGIAQAASIDSTLPDQPIFPSKEQGEAAHLSAEILTRYHYKPNALDDAQSKRIFDEYIKSLDKEKVFFLQSDIDRFSAAQTLLDDSIFKEDLTIPFDIFNLYKQRIAERFTYARSLLKQGFDFTKSESYTFERDKGPWLKTDDEMNELWQKRVKNDWLRLKLAGKNDKSIVETLDKRYETSLKGLGRLKSEDAFQAFMNAYTLSIDPHTNYFGIHASEEFAITMKSSLDGIGAMLEEKDEYTVIRELVPGGPAALSGKLKTGDRIIGVGQGDKSTIVDVTGWRVDDTVDLIRGPTDSTVVLEILPAEAGQDGKHVFIPLIRKKISLEQQDAKKSIIEVKDGNVTRRIGIITLPVFYEDFAARSKGDTDYKSASRDVAKLLKELKSDNVDSLLIDLRNNGGGSLEEAVNLTGLFINQGPVLQERDSKGNIKVDSDTNTGVEWDRPMGVLINRSSASASEIFAAAIQDYGRGIIIGENSFGKGTVQTVVDLDQIAKNDKPKFGELKMTIAQFFRINGGTTQLKGVSPDINFPVLSDDENVGESTFSNPLPWTQIKPADYKPVFDLKSILPQLNASHDARVSKDKDYQYLLKDVADMSNERKKNSISLNYAERQKERDARIAKLSSREDSSGDNGLKKVKANKTDSATMQQDDGLMSNERKIEDDLALEKAIKNTKDVLLNEAAHILSDEVGLLKTNTTYTIQ